MKHLSWLLFVLTILTFSACKKDDNKIVDAPANYSFERTGENSVSFSGQTTRLLMATELLETMKTPSTNALQMLEMYDNQTADGADANPFANETLNESTKSIQSKVAASYDLFFAATAESATIKSNLKNWISEQANTVALVKDDIATPNNPGQIALGNETIYVNEKGFSYTSLLKNSLIGALILDQTINNYLSTSILDEGRNRENNKAEVLEEDKFYTTMEHKWDEAYGYIFGLSSNPSNPISALSTEGEFMAKLLAELDADADFKGIAQDIFDAFKLGRSAIVVEEYEVRDNQAEILKEKLSIVLAARAIYHLQQGKNALPENGNSSDYGLALHHLSEGSGLVYSLRFCRAKDSNTALFSRNEIDDYMNSLNAGMGLWEVSAETLDSISNSIVSKFSFSLEEASE